MNQKNKIFIVGYYGWNNTGDDAMIYSLMSRLKNLYSTNEFVILSNKEIFLPPIKNKVQIIKPNNYLPIIWNIIDSSVFIVGGGTHFYDYGIKSNRILRLSQMLFLVTLARLFLSKIYFLGVGVDRISTFWGKILILNICKQVDYISLRDSFSYDHLINLGLNPNKISKTFDLAGNLNLERKKPLMKNDGKILGISILPFYSIYYKDKNKDNIFVKKIAEAIDIWLKTNSNNQVYIFIFKENSKDDDYKISIELMEHINNRKNIKLIHYNPNPELTLNKVSECDAFIGMRFHSCVFAFLSRIPLIIISYAEKNMALGHDIQLNKQAVLSLDNIFDSKLNYTIDNLIKYPEKFISKLDVEKFKEKSWTKHL